jgi:hypothetical protein
MAASGGRRTATRREWNRRDGQGDVEKRGEKMRSKGKWRRSATQADAPVVKMKARLVKTTTRMSITR